MNSTMTLKVLQTGSSGNCYTLTNGAETLIIEAGIPYKRILKGLDFNLMNVVGVGKWRWLLFE